MSRALFAVSIALALVACQGTEAIVKQDSPSAEGSNDSAIAARTPQFAWLAGGLGQAVSDFEKQRVVSGKLVCPANVATSGGNVHDLGDYALAKHVIASTASDVANADAAVRCLFTFEKSGIFAFHPGDAPKLSDNSNEFAMLPLGTLLNRYPVDAQLRADITPGVTQALDAIETHSVCPGYTNICLMQTAVMLSLGKWLTASPDAATRSDGNARIASGLARLDQWLQFTHDTGVTEFDSPTYSEVQLEVLLAARLAAPDALETKRLDAALDQIWASLAASYSPGRQLLAGPLSRTYDFVTAMGGISVSLYTEGLRTDLPTQSADLTKSILLLSADLGGYHPSPSILALGKSTGREVSSTYGADARQQRYLFVDADYTLGSASTDYGTSFSSDQDQMIRGELGASSKVPAIAVVPDYLDHPGTSVKAGSFDKITHLLMSPASVQKNGTLLTLLKVPAKDPGYVGSDGAKVPLVNLATNVVFPAQVDEALLDGQAIALTSDVTAGAHSSLVLRVGNGLMAIGVLEASGLDCLAADGSVVETGAVEPHLKPLAGPSSARGGTARLALYHLKTIPSSTSTLSKCFARVALLIAGAECNSASCAKDLAAQMATAIAGATQSFTASSGDWDVSARLGAGPLLHVHRIVSAADTVLAREVNGVAPAFAPLAVNGNAIALQPPAAVTLRVDQATTVWGQNVYVVGDAPELGAWKTANAVPLAATAYPTWTGEVDLRGGTRVQFKFIKKDSAGAVIWESGGNRELDVPLAGASYQESWH